MSSERQSSNREGSVQPGVGLRIVIVGAGSREFGPATVDDILLSDAICDREPELVLMGVDHEAVERNAAAARDAATALNRSIRIEATSDLEAALTGADFVIMAIEVRRYFYWSQDFHIPRQFGFKQIYGENGGPGGLFHALRNMGPCVQVARTMERVCPDAWLLNYTNPLTKLCQAQTHLSSVRVVGLCHGIFSGIEQVAHLLGRTPDSLRVTASGLNHITWMHSIQDATSGADLYPELKERERKAHWLSDWDDIALSRILYRTFGLYPSPGTNHIGEYVTWAQEFLASQDLQFFYDPKDGDPWEHDRVPPWIYNLRDRPTETPLTTEVREGRLVPSPRKATGDKPQPSGELAIPLIEGVVGNDGVELPAVNVPNAGYVPGLPEGTVVEVPAVAVAGKLEPVPMPRLPEPVLAILRRQVSINGLLVSAYEARSRDTLLQALLLDPTTTSYRAAVQLIDAMCERQADVLPDLEWSG